MRTLALTCGSLLLTAMVVGNAYFQKKQFYPSMIYLTKSSTSLGVLYLQGFVGAMIVWKLFRKVFFGEFRAAEIDHLHDRCWYAVMETCLAFTVFRDDFSPKFVALFSVLLFLKAFHWVAEDRVDYMERSPVISVLFHIRLNSLLLFLTSIDIIAFYYAYVTTIANGASVQLVFGFEYAILLTGIMTILIKYVVHCIDLRRNSPWENKAVYMLYADLLMSFLKVLIYIFFVAIMICIYTLPLFAIRPMYLSMRSLKKSFTDVILSRRAIHYMNTYYPDATPEELAASDNVCIICREEMVSESKKLPCNHIFHKACLRSWFQRQHTCPTCRLDVLKVPATRSQPNNNNQAQGQAGVQRQPNPPFGFDPVAALNQLFMQNIPIVPQRQQLQQATASTGQDNNSNNQSAGANNGNATGAPFAGQPTNANNLASGRPTAAVPSATENNRTIANQQQFPFFFPPFPLLPFGGMPFVNPHQQLSQPLSPSPMPDLSSLSLEELNEMEGQERKNVEMRIKCLKNIQLLLDASVGQLQQYMSAINSTTTNRKQTPSADISKPSKTLDLPGTSGTRSTSDGSDVAGASTSSENDELRKRRLNHFEAKPAETSTD